MAVINTNQKWLYLMEPHTASRAVADVLKKKLGGSEIGHHHIGLDELVDFRRQHIDPKQIKDYKIICTVRNPFDVLVTRYLFANQRIPFDEWVLGNREHPELTNPLRGLYENASYFVYYEYLNEGLSRTFSQKVEVPANDNHMTAYKGDWRDYYYNNPELIEFLLEKFTPFMTRFGYQLLVSYDYVVDMVLHGDKQAKLCRPIK